MFNSYSGWLKLKPSPKVLSHHAFRVAHLQEWRFATKISIIKILPGCAPGSGSYVNSFNTPHRK